MRVIIAGTRTIMPSIQEMNNILSKVPFNITSVLSGGATGIDTCAEKWAERYMIPLTIFDADWHKYGKAAGPIRNREMAKRADALVIIWDGKSPGSASMKGIAMECLIPIHEVIYA